MFRRASVSILIVGAAALLMSASASATTFCVPGYQAACPNSGGNVAQPDLQAAVVANGSDGVPDKIIIDSFTYVDPNRLEPDGTDDLTIVGAGVDKTIITSSTTLSDYVMTSGFGEREITLKDLSIVAPASMPDGGGAGLFLSDGHLENVNIVTKNPNTQTGTMLAGRITWHGGRIFGTDGGSFAVGYQAFGSEPGVTLLDGVSIEGADTSLYLPSNQQPVNFINGRITGTGTSAMVGGGGVDVAITNSVIEVGATAGLFMPGANGDTTHLDINSSTIVSAGHPAVPAISGSVPNIGGYGSLKIHVRNSIFNGFNSTYALSAPTSPGVGGTYINFEYSNFNLVGSRTGDGGTYIPASNINQDPLFTGPGDYSLKAGSPSIDAGDPDGSSDPATDILGLARPFDGNGDGTAIQDQGAFEYGSTPPPTCATNPALCPGGDNTAPVISKVKFKAAKGKKAGSLKFTLSEAATVKATFRPTDKKKPKRKTVKLSLKGKAGANTIKVRKGKLKPGKYKVSITATDAAGNKSKATTKTVKAKA